ncbi:DNA polymerase eta-like isoform X1 [Convolutriloba macropyga]|uniref:DNA polymerase eta-like isoform X1 n=1 Tax=Convolutriloba macropyga TaxID=536237 RepID=UPI003F520DBB
MENCTGSGKQRVIALIDMDCFYVQVEERDKPSLRGKPCSVVQYKPFRGGGIIAINYEARAKGVKRGMMGEDAKQVCPEMETVFVKESRGKADLTKYRQASAQVFQVLTAMCQNVERASIDEAFLDLTSLVDKRISELTKNDNDNFVFKPVNQELLPNTCVIFPMSETRDQYNTGLIIESECLETNKGSLVDDYDLEPVSNPDPESDRQKNLMPFLNYVNQYSSTANAEFRLALGAQIVEDIRRAVYEKTEFRCSAGIAHNKILAKLACGINKPNKQTILPHISIELYFQSLPVHKLRYLGGKLGDIVQEELGCVHVGDLLKYSESVLSTKFGERNGLFLYNICRGINFEPVKPRTTVKSIGCSKNFLGKESIWTSKEVNHWTMQLCLELEERLNEDMDLNQRVFKLVSVNYSVKGRGQISKRCPIINYDVNNMQAEIMKVILTSLPFKLERSFDRFPDPIIHLGTYASKAESASKSNMSITNFFNVTTEKTQIIFSKPSRKDNEKETGAKVKKPRKSALDIFLDSKRIRKLQPVMDRERNLSEDVEQSESSQTKMGALSVFGDINLCNSAIGNNDNSNSESLIADSDLDNEVNEDSFSEPEVLVPESPPELIRSCSHPGDERLSNRTIGPGYSPSKSLDRYLVSEDIDLLSGTPIVSSASKLFEDFDVKGGSRKANSKTVSKAPNDSSTCSNCNCAQNAENDSGQKSKTLSSILFDSESSCDSVIHVKSPPVERSLSAKLSLSEPKAKTSNEVESNKKGSSSQPKTPKLTSHNKRKRPNQSKSEQKASRSFKQAPLVFGNQSENTTKRLKVTQQNNRSSNVLNKSKSKSSVSEIIPESSTQQNHVPIESMFAKIATKRAIPDEIFEVVESNCDLMKCSLCEENISMFELTTHRDFHVAENLQRQFQRRT